MGPQRFGQRRISRRGQRRVVAALGTAPGLPGCSETEPDTAFRRCLVVAAAVRPSRPTPRLDDLSFMDFAVARTTVEFATRGSDGDASGARLASRARSSTTGVLSARPNRWSWAGFRMPFVLVGPCRCQDCCSTDRVVGRVFVVVPSNGIGSWDFIGIGC